MERDDGADDSAGAARRPPTRVRLKRGKADGLLRATENRVARARGAPAEAIARAGQLEATFEALVDAVVVFDREGRILRMNGAARALYGDYPPGAAPPLLQERIRMMDPRDDGCRPLPPERWPLHRILQGERLTGACAVEALVHSMAGSAVYLSVSGAPLYDAAGTIVGGTLVVRDVTERRRLESRTHEALDALLRMAEALVHVDDGAAEDSTATGTEAVAQRLVSLTCSVLGCQRVSITASDEATGESQPVAVVGLTPEQELAWRSRQPGASLREYLDVTHLERLWRDDVLVLDASEVHGRTLPYGARTLLLALMRAGQRVVGVLALDHGGVAHDYTSDEVALARAVARLTGFVIERARLLREHATAQASSLAMAEANRRMDAFLSLASHELKTPLTVVSGNIQIAERRLQRAAERDGRPLSDLAPLLGRARRNLARLNRLVDDLLDISRIQADRLPLRRDECDLVALVRDVVDEQRSLDPTRSLRLDLPILPAGTHVAAVVDAERIGQVVLNYLTNAFKYAPWERPIEVGVRVEGQDAYVWVRDEGPGLSWQDRERVWERFYRAEGVEHTRGSQVGLGLGLYISRSIVEQHGGRVGVESAAGAGATFWFTVPLARPA